MLTISEDGYIRLTSRQFASLSLSHLLTAPDLPGGDDALADATATRITGYTEWVSVATPSVTVGWDWEMVGTGGSVWLRRLNAPRSNVMLVDDAGKDLGPAQSARLLGELVDARDWQQGALDELGKS